LGFSYSRSTSPVLRLYRPEPLPEVRGPTVTCWVVFAEVHSLRPRKFTADSEESTGLASSLRNQITQEARPRQVSAPEGRCVAKICVQQFYFCARRVCAHSEVQSYPQPRWLRRSPTTPALPIVSLLKATAILARPISAKPISIRCCIQAQLR